MPICVVAPLRKVLTYHDQYAAALLIGAPSIWAFLTSPKINASVYQNLEKLLRLSLKDRLFP